MSVIPPQLRDKTSWNQWREATGYPSILLKEISFKGDDLADYDFIGVVFESCSFEEATLHQTNFRTAKFDRCSFKNSKFWQTCFEDTDVRTCFFNDFPTNCWTQGAIVTPRQMALIDAHRKNMIVLERDIKAPD